MTADRQELFRIAILRVLDEQRSRFGLGVLPISLHLRKFGFTAADFGSEENFQNAIADELQYLCNKVLVEEVLKVISKGNRAWRITNAGIDFLDSNP